MEKENCIFKNNYEYIFDKSQSMFNITKDEYNIVIDRKQSPDKILLIERLRYIIQHEYGKYCNSNVRKEPISEDYESCLIISQKNDEVQNAQKAISTVLNSYNSRQTRMLTKHSHNIIDRELLNTLNNNYWIEALLFYLLTHVTFTSAYQALLNLINRYYCALSNLRLVQGHDDELIQQINILYPFVRFKEYDPEAYSFTNNAFIRKTIIALYKNQEHKREDFFRLLQLFESLYYTNQPLSKRCICFNAVTDIKIKIVPSQTFKPWELCLRDIKDEVKEYTISAEAILNIRKGNQDGDKCLEYFLSLFTKNYKDYVQKYSEKWANIIRHQAEVDGSESWYAFLLSYLKKMEVNCLGKDVLMPDYCYDYILYRHVMSQNELTSESSILDKQLTNKLIDLLHKNESNNQYRLYENCFSLMFILSKINAKEDIPMKELAQSDPICKDSLEFLNPILNDEYINTSVMSIEQVKRLFKIIIGQKEFYENMRFVPHKFEKYDININASILLKLLALLMKTNINKNSVPLFKHVSATKLAQILFKIEEKKEADNIRKTICDTADTKFFKEEYRKIAKKIYYNYYQEIIDYKK